MSFDIRTWPLFTEQQASSEPYGHTIRNMKMQQFYTCGFIIYRSTYRDDDLWSHMIEKIRTQTLARLDRRSRAEILGPLISWTVIEDQEALEGATVKQVQERFLEWSEDMSDERDGPGARGAFLMPRYNFCAMIDQKCLDSLAAHEREAAEAAAVGKPPLLPGAALPVFVIFIRIDKPLPAWVLAEQASWRLSSTTLNDSGSRVGNGQVLDDEDNNDVDEEVVEDEDETEDWMYVQISLFMSLYECCQNPSSYWNYYVRPPGIN